MIQQSTYTAIKQLSIAERILLAEKIWDSIAAEQELMEVTKAQKDELDHRIDFYHASPDEGASWDEIKGRVKKK
ncbi:MAG: addiction module protein [Candidatus Hatepunaea meridiana]|nr:addiction module protein [Candidatus Hatepunaea meridiana]